MQILISILIAAITAALLFRRWFGTVSNFRDALKRRKITRENYKSETGKAFVPMMKAILLFWVPVTVGMLAYVALTLGSALWTLLKP